jgi:hypothetical protein
MFISNKILVILFLVLLIASLLSIGFWILSYNKEINDNLLPALLDGILQNVVYKKDAGITAVNIKPLGMIEQGKKLISNNYISGIYKNTKIEMSNVKLDDVRPALNNKKETYFNLFNGKWFVIELKYGFVDDVLICGKYSNMAKIGSTRVETGDNIFDEKYRIFSNSFSQVLTFFTEEKRKQLDEFMQNIKYDTLFYFHGDKLHIAINGIDKIPKLSLFKKYDVSAYRGEVFKELAYIIGLLEQYGFYGNDN